MSIVEYTGPSNPQEIRQYLMRRTKDEIVREYLRQWRYSGEVENERDAAADYARDQAAVLDLVAKALGVPDEPHQGRAERILEAAEGLAAHVERLKFWAYAVHAANNTSRVTGFDRLLEAVDASPTTSLDRLKAKWQAEALEEVCDDRNLLSTEELRFRAVELRRQAEEDS